MSSIASFLKGLLFVLLSLTLPNLCMVVAIQKTGKRYVFKVDIAALDEQFEQLSFDCESSIISADGLSSSEALSLSFGDLRGDG